MSTALAARVADRLDCNDRAYLVGDLDTARSRIRLLRIGAVDAHGKLTPFGVLLARHVAAEDAAPAWTEDDSARLTALLVCDGARMRLRDAAERKAAVSALAVRGLSAQEISRRIGGQPGSVTKLAREIGTPIRHKTWTGFTYADGAKVLAAKRGTATSWEES